MKAHQAYANRLRIVVVRDEHRWRAYCPEFEADGASTWGRTRQEAVRHIREVLDMIAGEGAVPLSPSEFEALTRRRGKLRLERPHRLNDLHGYLEP